jgi:hypothetical protein
MTTSETILYCANHPTVETTLRCNRCEKPICTKCAVLTPTGYRCKECVRSQQKVFDTALWYDYITGFLAAGILSLIASQIIGFLGRIGFFGWILVVIAAPAAGLVISEGVRLVIGRRRSRSLFLVIVVAVVLGALPLILTNILFFNLFPLIFQGIYLFLTVPTVYYRLSGIRLSK